MPTTRSKSSANGKASSEDTLAEILRFVRRSEERLKTIESTLEKHSEKQNDDNSGIGTLCRDGGRCRQSVRRSRRGGDQVLKCSSGKNIPKRTVSRRATYDEGVVIGSASARIFATYCVIFISAVIASYMTGPELPERLTWEDAQGWSQFFIDRMHYPFIFAALYVVVIFTLQRIMKDREEFNLRKPLAVEHAPSNVSLSGAVRTVPVI